MFSERKRRKAYKKKNLRKGLFRQRKRWLIWVSIVNGFNLSSLWCFLKVLKASGKSILFTFRSLDIWQPLIRKCFLLQVLYVREYNHNIIFTNIIISQDTLEWKANIHLRIIPLTSHIRHDIFLWQRSYQVTLIQWYMQKDNKISDWYEPRLWI